MPDLSILRQAQAERSVLPGLLERIADELPNPSEELVADVSSRMDDLLTLHHREDEAAFFPALLKACRSSDSIGLMIQVLRQEHDMERMLASEVAMHLQDRIEDRSSIEADALGYALRNLFELQRRHLVWESTILLPIAMDSLDADDRRVLTHLLRSIRGATEPERCSSDCDACKAYRTCSDVTADAFGDLRQ